MNMQIIYIYILITIFTADTTLFLKDPSFSNSLSSSSPSSTIVVTGLGLGLVQE